MGYTMECLTTKFTGQSTNGSLRLSEAKLTTGMQCCQPTAIPYPQVTPLPPLLSWWQATCDGKSVNAEITAGHMIYCTAIVQCLLKKLHSGSELRWCNDRDAGLWVLTLADAAQMQPHSQVGNMGTRLAHKYHVIICQTVVITIQVTEILALSNNKLMEATSVASTNNVNRLQLLKGKVWDHLRCHRIFFLSSAFSCSSVSVVSHWMSLPILGNTVLSFWSYQWFLLTNQFIPKLIEEWYQVTGYLYM